MTLELAYNNDILDFKKQLEDLATIYSVTIKAYNESHYLEKKKAYRLKGGYSARLVPFALFKDDNHEIPFYSESNECTLDNISEILNRYCNVKSTCN